MRQCCLAAVMFLTSCASPDGGPVDRSFDACAPLRLAAVDASDDEFASIREAAQLWTTANVTTFVTTPSAATTIAITFERGAPAFYGFFDGTAAAIYINNALSGHARAVAIAHELGHALGLPHIASRVRPSVMNQGNLVIEPGVEDAAAVAELWGRCVPE